MNVRAATGRRLRVALAASLLAALAVVAAGCGGGGSSEASTSGSQTESAKTLDDVVAAVDGLSADEREQKLVDLAKQQGGKVTVYSSLSKLVVKPLEKAWAKAYPDVELEFFRISSEDLTQRVLQEANAGQLKGDVIETNGTEMTFLADKGNILAPAPDSPQGDKLPAKYRFDDFTADRVEKFIAAWNTNLVDDGEIPHDFAGFADPKWKNKIALEPTDGDWFATLFRYQQQQLGKSEKELNATWKKIAANAQVIKGHTTEATLMASGQVAVVLGAHAQSVEQLKDEGAPLEFKPFIEPVLSRAQGMGIAQDAAHPAAALLYYDWVLGPEGQQVMLDNGVEPSNPDFEDPAFVPEPTTVDFDLDYISQNLDAWQSRYDRLLRGKKVIEEED
jgi:iron(III) transport system substrate-binding protein